MTAPATNPLQQLAGLGQSFWLDNIRRGFTRSGQLREMILSDGLRGATSNPTIFQKAISEHGDYDDEIRALARAGKDAREIYDALTTTDIREACDVFAAVYASTGLGDGFVSIELPPDIAKDTQASIVEGRRLWATIARPNLMIKVPASKDSMPVIRILTADGINVNITLMFGAQYYEQVIDAYFAGLEERVQRGLPIHHISSVASCFVSRVDTEVDKRLRVLSQEAPGDASTIAGLRGEVGIANAKRLYQMYRRSVASDRWKKLAEKGPRRQRPLWASTSTKDPKLPDTHYVEALIGPETIDTVPMTTIEAFRDHGNVAATLEEGMRDAESTLKELDRIGISLEAVTDQLLTDGLVNFEKSYNDLFACIQTKINALQGASQQAQKRA